MADAQSQLTVRFGRLPRRGLLLGLSAIRVACVACSAATFVPMLFIGGVSGVAAASPLWLTFVVLAFARWGGQPAAELVPTATHFILRRSRGQTRFRRGPNRPRPSGTLALPGDAAPLRFHIDGVTGAAMLHDPHAHTLTAVALVRHPAYVLLSPEDQARRVHGWGRALAGLASTGTCATLQVLEVALPDSGRGITGWWDAHGSKDPRQWVVREYEDLMRTCAPAASTHRTLVAISLDLRKAKRHIRQSGRGLAGASAFLRQEMTSLEASLRGAELQLTGWLDEREMAATLRTAYDPVVDLDGDLTHSLSTAGPVAVDEHWDHVRHDTGYSAVLWISEWPRVAVPPFFLHSLVFQPGIRKSLSLTFEPVPADAALRDIRRAKVEYATDAAQKAKLGTLADLADSAEREDVLERERALISGHADIRFTGMLAVTATTRDALEAALAEIARAATQSGCETRRLFGRQARAFAVAALPLARKVSA